MLKCDALCMHQRYSYKHIQIRRYLIPINVLFSININKYLIKILANCYIYSSRMHSHTYLSIFSGCISFKYNNMVSCPYRDMLLSVGSAIDIFFKLAQGFQPLICNCISVYKTKLLIVTLGCAMSSPRQCISSPS